jgi:hypothetical protein
MREAAVLNPFSDTWVIVEPPSRDMGRGQCMGRATMHADQLFLNRDHLNLRKSSWKGLAVA